MSDDWSWETDAENKLTFVSDRVETLTGWSKEDLLGTRSWDLSRDSPGPWKEQQRTIEQSGRIVEFELETKASDGTMRSEERRGGTECVRTRRSRWSPYHDKHKSYKTNHRQNI